MFHESADKKQRLTELQAHVVSVPFGIDWRPQRLSDGERPSNANGNGLDYRDFRDYRPGDNMRRLNWRMLDRAPDRPAINIFEAERKISVSTLVDVGTSMHYGSQDLSKLELSAVLAGSVISSAAKSAESAGAICFDQRQIVSNLQLGSGGANGASSLAPLVMNTVLNDGRFPGAEPVETSCTESSGYGLANALQLLPNTRSLVFIISDFATAGENEWVALHRASCWHEIVCLIVSDLRERELPAVRLLPWLPIPAMLSIRTASGEDEQILSTRKRRLKFAEESKARRAILRETITGSGAKCANFATDQSCESRRQSLALMFASKRLGTCLDQNLSDLSCPVSNPSIDPSIDPSIERSKQ